MSYHTTSLRGACIGIASMFGFFACTILVPASANAESLGSTLQNTVQSVRSAFVKPSTSTGANASQAAATTTPAAATTTTVEPASTTDVAMTTTPATTQTAATVATTTAAETASSAQGTNRIMANTSYYPTQMLSHSATTRNLRLAVAAVIVGGVCIAADRIMSLVASLRGAKNKTIRTSYAHLP